MNICSYKTSVWLGIFVVEVIIMDVNLKAVSMFKAFGDETRLKIINIIQNDSLCVSEICEKVGMKQSAVSHQLQILRTNGIVKYEKKGKEVYYCLDDDHIKTIIKTMYDHISHHE